MKKFIQNKLKEQKGLTLIELLAVIVILAIIAAIAIPAIGNIINNSRVGASKSDVLNAISAAELYMADNPNATTVTLADLENGNKYIDDKGSLTDITYNPANKTVFAKTSTNNGKITIQFGDSATAGVTKAAVSALPNNTTGAAAAPATGITVTRK